MSEMSFGFKATFVCLLKQEPERGIMFIGNYSIKYGILDSRLEFTHYRGRSQTECVHYLQTVNRRLEIANTVTLLKVHHFLTYQLEVLKMTLFLEFVLGGDIGLT